MATLALGIGANAALFTVLRAVVLRPPPFADHGRLVVFHGVRHGQAQGPLSSSLPDYEDWRESRAVFESI